MKYFVFSIDDGTVFDAKTIAILNRLGMKGSFNLNSGLDDYVWYLDGFPIRRLRLKENRFLYEGHEVASHSLTHPYLDGCDENEVARQVNEDVTNLEGIFEREVRVFATPFEICGEREVQIIREHTQIKAIRMSRIDESFALPIDPYHIPCTCFDIHRAKELLPSFKAKKGDALFVYAGHSYDFEVANTFPLLSSFLQDIQSDSEIENVTFGELSQKIF